MSIIGTMSNLIVKMLNKQEHVPVIYSRHPSHGVLRGKLPPMRFRSVIRFGSTTMSDAPVQLNSVKAIENSSSKLRMKDCFSRANVRTADWCTGGSNSPEEASVSTQGIINFAKDKYPIVAKNIFGSRGTGNHFIRGEQELRNFMHGKDLSSYIFERYHAYNREYRLHVTNEGCFYACRKMLKRDAPKNVRWYRNDANCVWILEDNPNFDRPINWQDIVDECVKALNSCGLDFGACDLRVESAKTKEGAIVEDPRFIVVEINSAPSLATITTERYLEMLPKLLLDKRKNK